MTERLRKWIGRQGLDYPFTEIGKQVGVDEKTVRTIFAEYVKELEKNFRRETPTILGLDEIYLSTPRGVITNIGDRCLVDMLDNRRKVTIVEFLRSLPNPEKIQAVSTDMYRPYRESIPDDLAKQFRAITTAWRTWRKQILAYFECPITNAFTESFNSKIRKAYQEGNGYSFKVLRAKVLFSDILQKKARKVENIKVKKRPRFDDVPQNAMYLMMGPM